MIREYNTIREAAELWVSEFDAIQQGMIAKLMQNDPDEWSEVTKPAEGNTVYVYDVPEELDTLEHGGKIRSYDEESELYCIELYDGKLVSAAEGDFEVERDDMLPMWGTMWQFHDSCDNWWMEDGDGIEVMSVWASGFTRTRTSGISSESTVRALISTRRSGSRFTRREVSSGTTLRQKRNAR